MASRSPIDPKKTVYRVWLKIWGIEVIRRRVSREETYIADEAFLTGTAAELTPVREIDARVIGKGGVGDMTQELQRAYFDVVTGNNPKYIDSLTYIN